MHRVWLSGEPLPQLAQEFLQGWERLHPEWQQNLWTSENLPEMVNRDLFDAATNWAAKTDILRYELMRQYGGVYMDVDVEPKKNIDLLILGLDAFASRLREEDAPYYEPKTSLEIAILGAVPNHPLFENLVDNMREWQTNHPDANILLSTGPYYFSEKVIAWKQGDRQGYDLTEFPPKFFQPFEHWELAKKELEHPEAYAIHWCWGSWNNWNGLPPHR